MSELEGGARSAEDGGLVEVNGQLYRLLAKRVVRSDLHNADREYELTMVDEYGLNPDPLPPLGYRAYLWAFPSLPVGVILVATGSVLSVGPETWRFIAWCAMTILGAALIISTPARYRVNAARRRGKKR
jgi:hypothetical protein